jgi:hypothetical protein
MFFGAAAFRAGFAMSEYGHHGVLLRQTVMVRIFLQMHVSSRSNYLSRGSGLPHIGHSFSVDLIMSFTLQWVHTTSQSFILFPSTIIKSNSAAKRPRPTTNCID